MAKVTYVEFGQTVSKNYNSKKLTLGAEVEEGETVEQVVASLQLQVEDFLSGRKHNAAKLRALANKVERGEVDMVEGV